MQGEVKRSSQNLPHAVFVYGTLKREQPNHYILEKFGNHHFFGTGCTELSYPLIIDTHANLPFLLDAPGKGQVCSILVTNFISLCGFLYRGSCAISCKNGVFLAIFFCCYVMLLINYRYASALHSYALIQQLFCPSICLSTRSSLADVLK